MPPKRKVPSSGLERRVRPRRQDNWKPEPEAAPEPSDSDDDSPAEEEQRIAHVESDSEDSNQEDSSDNGSSAASSLLLHKSPPFHLNLTKPQKHQSSSESHPPKVDLSSVSFGALARAQASLPSPRRHESDPLPPNNQDASSSLTKSFKPPAKKPPAKRSSKHAPQEQTSKRPVTRTREIVPDARRKPRDPRFDPLVGKLDEGKARRAYAFLDEYRESEMAELRAEIKKTKNPLDRERLKRQLMSMESRKKAQKKKDEEQNLLAEHRQKEKELVAQGKTPFYLKRSEQKKQLLMNRYEKMSKGQVDRAIERKRKKVVGKEKKELGGLVRRRR